MSDHDNSLIQNTFNISWHFIDLATKYQPREHSFKYIIDQHHKQVILSIHIQNITRIHHISIIQHEQHAHLVLSHIQIHYQM